VGSNRLPVAFATVCHSSESLRLAFVSDRRQTQILECAITEEIEKMRENTDQSSNPFARSQKPAISAPSFSHGA